MHYGLALVGFGGVNRGLVEVLLLKKQVLKQQFDIELSIVSISDIYLGYAHHEDGLDLETLMSLPSEKGALSALPNGQVDADNNTAICANAADIIVEATYTNPNDGEPAVSHCRTAISHNKHIVTTNKGPVALFGNELRDLANTQNTCFEFEGTVMSGTPVLGFVSKNLQACTINGFRGILNGTANYVLQQVEDGKSMADAIKIAQELGYAEADPTADIEGFDVMLKVVILANQLLGANLKTTDVIREGIVNISEEKIRSATAEGKHWKLIGQASINEDGSISASVSPQCLPVEDTLSSVSGPINAIAFDTDLMGTVMVSGAGAGRIETAYALLADILNIHETMKSK
jgi:homoserine dehydrogenase